MSRLLHNSFIFSVITVYSLLVACGPADTASAPPRPTSAAVTVYTLTSKPLTLTRELPGRITPIQIAEVRPQVTGIVKQVLFTEGGKVEAGQPLYQLDDARYRAEFNSAKAALARAQAALDIARLNAGRSAQLVEKGTVSKSEFDNTAARLKQAEADVAVAAAGLASSEVMLGYTQISAPISGRIGKSAVTQGALVTANQDELLATIQKLDPVYVDLNQSASELIALREQLQQGTLRTTADIPVTILLENGTAYPQPGKLMFSEVTVDPSTGSYMLRVEVPNAENLLLPGMYVRAVVSTGTRDNAVLVPQQGISRDPKGNATAMIVGADGKAEMRPVVLSQALGDQWLVESGLAAGDQVIIEGLQKVRPGMSLQITQAGENEPPASTAVDQTAP
jgi:membrane fusion protein (multidrug efflux system)